MAARKKAGAKKAAAKRSRTRVVKRKAAAKAKPKASPKKAPAKTLKARSLPETLRLKSFTPSLTVNDLAASLAFYEGGLGFIVGERWMDGEVLRGVMLKAGASEFALSQDDWKMGRDRKKGQGVRIYITTADDVDAYAKAIQSRGGTLDQDPKDDWGFRAFSITDPDGYKITIMKPLK